jgi:uncharacterized protein YeaO (DUF488 family)
MAGKLYLVSVSNLKKLPTNIFVKLLITRKKLDIAGVAYAPKLAPSKQLFNKYLKEWKNKPPEEWWDKYSTIFNEELKYKKPQLRRLYKLLSVGIDVALICFCNRKECHRYLVADYLAKYGAEVIEIK